MGFSSPAPAYAGVAAAARGSAETGPARLDSSLSFLLLLPTCKPWSLPPFLVAGRRHKGANPGVPSSDPVAPGWICSAVPLFRRPSVRVRHRAGATVATPSPSLCPWSPAAGQASPPGLALVMAGSGDRRCCRCPLVRGVVGLWLTLPPPPPGQLAPVCPVDTTRRSRALELDGRCGWWSLRGRRPPLLVPSCCIFAMLCLQLWSSLADATPLWSCA